MERVIRNGGGEADVTAGSPASEALPGARAPLLSEIGAIVRRARAKRGMTRKALAAASKTSERYLAQIESGEGNPTVLVLEAVAQGLGLTLFDLLPPGERDGARERLTKRLRRLSDAQVQAVARFLDTGEIAAPQGSRGRRIAL